MLPHLHNLLLSLDQAKSLLNSGGLLVYPTETFYALACHPENDAGLQLICRIKQRPRTKPLPLLAASTEAAAAVVDLTACPASLTSLWPAPLSLLLPAKKQLAQALINQQHKAAIRVSPNLAATSLAKACGGYLPATSANLAGRKPAITADGLEEQFLQVCTAQDIKFGIYAENRTERPCLLPSTLAEPVKLNGRWLLRILRQGSLAAKTLTNASMDLIS